MKSVFPKEFEDRIYKVLEFGLEERILKELTVKTNGDIVFANDFSSSVGTIIFTVNDEVFDMENHFVISYKNINFKIALQLFKDEKLIGNIKYNHKTEEDRKAFEFKEYISDLFDFQNNLYIYHYLEELENGHIFDYYRVVHYPKGIDFIFQSDDYGNEKLLLKTLPSFIEKMFGIIVTEENFKLESLPEYANMAKVINY